MPYQKKLPQHRNEDSTVLHIAKTPPTENVINFPCAGNGKFPIFSAQERMNGEKYSFTHAWQPLAATCSHLQPLLFSSAATCTHLRPIEWPPVATSIFFSSAATCSHLQPIEWLPVAASGRQSKWPQVAARASGRKWPQVAAFAKIKFVPFCTLSEILGFLSKQTFLHWFGNFHFVQARQVYYQLWCFLVGQWSSINESFKHSISESLPDTHTQTFCFICCMALPPREHVTFLGNLT